MNRLKASGVISIFILIICYIGFQSIYTISNKSINYIEQVENSKSENISELYKNFQEYWNKKSKILAMIIHHEHLEEIDQKVAELESSIEKNEEFEVSKCCKCIKTSLKNLKETYEINLSNII